MEYLIGASIVLILLQSWKLGRWVVRVAREREWVN